MIIVRIDPTDRVPIDPGDTAGGQALLALAARVDVASVDLARAAANVRAVWLGPHRSRFDAEQARRDAQAAAVIASCRRLSTR